MFGLLLLFGLSASVWAAPKTLLVLGDSLSAGYGIRIEQAWPSLMQQKLGKDWQVVNASVSGETTAGGLTRLPAALKQHKPAVVLVELGANDGLRGLPVEAAKLNLSTIIEQSRKAGARVGLIAIRLPPNFGGAYTTKFDAMFRELAKQHKLPAPPFLLDGIAEHPEMFLPDQLHPTAAAQPKVLANVWPLVQTLTKR